jgi:Flp pilus assembly protein TadG
VIGVRLSTLLARFSRNERATAAVEFALIMPVLLLLYFGSMEASVLYTADKRVNTISATVGDLIAQWNPDDGTIASATLDTYFASATGIMAPYSATGLKQVVSLIFVNSTGVTSVLWSKASGGGTVRTVGQPYAPLTATSMTNQVSRSGCIVAAETSYSYKPLFGQVFKTALTLGHTNYFVPRYGATAVIQPAGLSPAIASTACGAS